MWVRVAGSFLVMVIVGLAGCTLPPEDPAPPPSYEAPLSLSWSWEEAPPLPAPVHGAACTAYRDDAWVLGGLDRNGLVTGQVQRWDPATEAWSRAGGLATPVHHATAVVVTDTLQVVGGYPEAFRGAPIDTVQERSAFDFFVETASLPRPLAEAETATLGGRPMLGGGTMDGRTASTTLLAWDRLDGWTRFDGTLASARAGHALSAWNDTLLVAAGGWTADGMTNDAEAQSLSGSETVTFPGVPTPRTHAATAAQASQVFLIGGEDAAGEATTASEYLDLDQGQWLRTRALPVAITDACAVALPDGIHLFGGLDKKGDPLDTHLVLRKGL